MCRQIYCPGLAALCGRSYRWGTRRFEESAQLSKERMNCAGKACRSRARGVRQELPADQRIKNAKVVVIAFIHGARQFPSSRLLTVIRRSRITMQYSA